MAKTYDPTTTAGRVRLIAGDTDAAVLIFDDAEIDAFLSLEQQNPALAAARALESLAANKVRILGAFKDLDLEIKGDAVSRELRELASQIRDNEKSSAAYGIAEMVTTPAQWRERVFAQALRASAGL